MDVDGTIADWNELACETFGWESEEAIGKSLGELIVPLKFRNAHTEGLKRFLTTGIGPVLRRRIEISALHKSGTEFPVELSITPYEDAGKMLFIGFVRDITKRQRRRSTT